MCGHLLHLPCIILLSAYTFFFLSLNASVVGRVLDSRKRCLGNVIWMLGGVLASGKCSSRKRYLGSVLWTLGSVLRRVLDSGTCLGF